MMKKKYYVGGMSCAACSAAVERAVGVLDGVENVSVNLLGNSMSVEFNPKKITDFEIISAVEKAGFTAEIYSASAMKEKRKILREKEKKSLLKRVIFSGIILAFLMYISMGHMISLPLPDFIGNNPLVFAVSQFVLSFAVCIINKKYFTDGFRSLFKGRPNMNSLIAIGSSAAMVYGIYAIGVIVYADINSLTELSHHYMHQLYFESAATILTLVTLGKFLEAKAKSRTGSALEKLSELSPKTVTVEVNGEEKTVPFEDVMLGDIVLIKPGESIAVDGVVLSGNASLDTSAITGESVPKDVAKDDKVISGSINLNGFIKIKATAVGEDTTLAEIVSLVEQAGQSKAPISKTADKISGVFVPTVIVIGVITAVVWLLAGQSPDFALSRAISVLVISCPCALGLATPAAIMVSFGVGAKHGVLIKSAETLEMLHRADSIVFDKTGTVTEGKPFVTDTVCIHCEKNKLLEIAASLESKSEHPLAGAITEKCKEKNIQFTPCDEIQILPGKGLSGCIDGEIYFAGNEKLMEEKNINISEADNIIKPAKSSVYISDENNLLGIIYIGDKIKDDSRCAIETLNSMGKETYMLTGDNEYSAKDIAEKASIKNVIFNMLPGEKEKFISKLKQEGKFTVMVGDGINDAPSLASADVGIAVGNGTDIAIESADIVLTKNTLSHVVTAIKLSKATLRTIKMNLFWALIYNSIGIPVAAGVLFPAFGIVLNPMFAAAAMSLSSVCVVLNALSLNFFKE